MPTFSEIVETFGHPPPSIFSSLDCTSEFLQLRLSPESSRLLGLQSDSDSYRMTHLPFGLTTSPFVFQRLTNRILTNYQYIFAVSYIDNILCYSQDWESHMTHLRLILQRVLDSGLRLRAEKCKFAQTKLSYLGMILTKDSIEPDPEKLEIIKNASPPKSAKMLKSFLGLTGFYRMYIRGYSNLIAPFRNLLKKNVSFEWTDDHKKAFQQLKSATTKHPVFLAVPNWNQPRALITDASRKGCGFIIVKEDSKGKQKVLAYGGRLWSKAESQWSVTELELACILFALEKYSHFFIGSEFKIYTDHISNTFVRSLKFSHGKLYRWSLRLQHYNFQIVHLPGKNMPADFLSRIVDKIDPEAPDLTDEGALVYATDEELQPVRPSVLRLRDVKTRKKAQSVYFYALALSKNRANNTPTYKHQHEQWQ